MCCYGPWDRFLSTNIKPKLHRLAKILDKVVAVFRLIFDSPRIRGQLLWKNNSWPKARGIMLDLGES